MEIKEINEVDFGILSEDEILKLSVAEITKNRLFTKNKESELHTLYDPRMGPMESKQVCCTCNLKTKDCPGHFGHIVLNVRIVHPLFYKMVLKFLKCFCIKCSTLLITNDHIMLWNIQRLQGEQRFTSIMGQISKFNFCTKCNTIQPKYTHVAQEGTFFTSYEVNGRTEKVKISTDEIYSILLNVKDDDIRILGFDPTTTHPKSLVFKILPVIPPRSRPFIVTENVICDDDLTIGYSEIIKANNHIMNCNLSDPKRQKYIDALIFRIKTLMDNSNMKAKHTNSRPMKGLKERLCGKDGLIRSNLMGKRGNFSARTVIGPDPTLRLNEMALPIDIAKTLSYNERVTRYNIGELQQLVWEGKVNMIDKKDDNDHHTLSKTRRIYCEIALKSQLRDTVCKLDIGDIVHRQLRNGDYVLLNRQPTLHKGSMLAKRIVLRPARTIRMNLATTGSFNADFDGDEMNIFVPQSEPSRAELQLLSSTEHNLIGTQTSTSVITIVQDALLGCYLMTLNNESIPQSTFHQLSFSCDTELDTPGGFRWDWLTSKLKTARYVFDTFNKPFPTLCGKTLFSLLLPEDFNYTCKNNGDPNEPVCRVYRGILYEGCMTKTNLKGGALSLITLLNKEYGQQSALHFVNNVQFLSNAYVLYKGFSVGIKDCIPSHDTSIIDSILAKSYVEAEVIEEHTNNPVIREAKVNIALSKVKDIGMRIAKESLSKHNNFVKTVTAGSKGDYFNIAQIMGVLGQQNISGSRVKHYLNKGRRTLHHYPMDVSGDKSVEFESRGFIKNSFLRGLKPQEFWFHAMSGREGITDTAMKTAQSGYTQRKMVKIMEDVQVKYDNTVRNSVGSIIQFSYGGDGLCGTKTVLKKGRPSVCDIQRLVEQLNTQHEIQTEYVKR